MCKIAASLVNQFPNLDEESVIKLVEKESKLTVTLTGDKNILWFDIINSYRNSGGKIDH